MGLRKDYTPGGLALEDEFDVPDDVNEGLSEVARRVNEHPLADPTVTLKELTECATGAVQEVLAEVINMIHNSGMMELNGNIKIHRAGRDVAMMYTDFTFFIPITDPYGRPDALPLRIRITDDDIYIAPSDMPGMAMGIYTQFVEAYDNFYVGDRSPDVVE